jgi:preprotein translocase subunit SecB
MTDKTEPSFRVHRIYTKNSLFEAGTLTVSALEAPPVPTLDLQIHADVLPQDSAVYEAVVTLNIIAKSDDKTLWSLKLQQAGLYSLLDFTEEQKQNVLNGFCMNQLYPYASVAVNHMVVQGGFAPIYLSPMNFEQLYQQQKTKAA